VPAPQRVLEEMGITSYESVGATLVRPATSPHLSWINLHVGQAVRCYRDGVFCHLDKPIIIRVDNRSNAGSRRYDNPANVSAYGRRLVVGSHLIGTVLLGRQRLLLVLATGGTSLATTSTTGRRARAGFPWSTRDRPMRRC